MQEKKGKAMTKKNMGDEIIVEKKQNPYDKIVEVDEKKKKNGKKSWKENKKTKKGKAEKIVEVGDEKKSFYEEVPPVEVEVSSVKAAKNGQLTVSDNTNDYAEILDMDVGHSVA